MNPLVSVVINNFNYARFVEEAIESALRQTYDNLEVIVVDDGSTDGSRDIINGYSNRCTVVLKRNGGQASAFNVGIGKAKGEYILLLDSDDVLFPDAVATFVAAFPRGYARVFCAPRFIDEQGHEKKDLHKERYFQRIDGSIFATVEEGGRFFGPPTSANFIHGDTLRSIGSIPEEDFRICADAYVLVHTGLRGRVRSIDKELVAYRIHGGNNFAIASVFPYSDGRRVKTRIDDHYRMKRLLADACRAAGLDYVTEPDDENYCLLKCLCVARRMALDSVHLRNVNRAGLLVLVVRYLRCGRLPLLRRIAQSGGLVLILALPERLSLGFVRRIDQKRADTAAQRNRPPAVARVGAE